ncbi:GL25720 [Drosophila persimilis]|uniref:GL25720 n=1 Tax=Drosophila persimilis TaxID=7234 RepID=B4GK98_DROPE|nr:GL25720 [Drosophila persimilis]
MVWCLLVIFFALKLLSSLTVLYFRSEESIGERSMVIVACLVYLQIAFWYEEMGSLITKRKRLRPFQVFCDTEIEGPGRIVIACRTNKEQLFFRDWLEYKNGFG